MTQKNEACINDLLNMSDPSDTNNCQSEVSQCYTGCNILVTGGSGFLGILLIERLLRQVYDKLKKEQPDFISKVVMIEADMGEADFGISPENRKRLLDTNIIFHLAAAVLFNRTIQFMVNVNAFVYVSTAYSYCMHKAIDEKYYTPPLETDKILTLLNVLDDKTLEKITPILIGEWPNTYVYTKAIAEDTVRQYSVGLPACIVRPSIVIATAKDPIAGWINNVYGATGILVGAAMGFLRCLHCVSENKADIIPADYVIANIIVAAWDTAKRKNTLLSIDNTDPNISETKRVPIYNYVSSTQNPVTWKTFMYLIEKHGLNIPPLNAIWYYMLLLIRYRFVYEICTIFLHTIPGAIFDILAVLTGRRPILLKSYKKLHTFNGVISYFATREWQFRNDSVVKLWNCLNPIDREIFNFNIQDLSWDEYIKNMIFGLRMYMVKESIDNLEEAHVRYKK
ncbi:Fatty acyl-CoA reductase 1 [Harpegnathos saltator]|uniref:Fatty acyl-CoA reductase n=1 Tax=Harpegnathos saltator TaxID=610380 RepID=E2BXK9_HARSA|nr:Fatty acyl-CoA reductase 1 [Harpegnathos saltator]